MAVVNTAYIGREFTGTPPYVVSRAKISEFASAIQSRSPIHTDPQAAIAAGYSDVVAPATFAVTIAQVAEAEYINDPEAGIDFSRVVHANESFSYDRPIVAGDVLHTKVIAADITTRASLAMVTTRCEITDGTGAAVATVTSTLAIRGED